MPPAAQIVRAIGVCLGWAGTIGLGGADLLHPIVLDTTASEHLGYVPAGSSSDLLGHEVDLVAANLVRVLPWTNESK